jgi:hypothetical protein
MPGTDPISGELQNRLRIERAREEVADVFKNARFSEAPIEIPVSPTSLDVATTYLVNNEGKPSMIEVSEVLLEYALTRQPYNFVTATEGPFITTTTRDVFSGSKFLLDAEGKPLKEVVTTQKDPEFSDIASYFGALTIASSPEEAFLILSFMKLTSKRLRLDGYKELYATFADKPLIVRFLEKVSVKALYDYNRLIQRNIEYMGQSNESDALRNPPAQLIGSFAAQGDIIHKVYEDAHETSPPEASVEEVTKLILEVARSTELNTNTIPIPEDAQKLEEAARKIAQRIHLRNQ